MDSSIQQLYSQALFLAVRDGELLVGDLPEANTFDRKLFGIPADASTLNFRQKLGHLFEDALGELLLASKDLLVLAKNLQLFSFSKTADVDERTNNRGRETLGEMDFLLFDKVHRQHIHLELAIKFYLIHELDGRAHFPGPDPRDNWLKKLERMREHQLVLSQSDEVRAFLWDRFKIEHLGVRQLIYGCMFDHIDAVPCFDAPAVRKNCCRGRWLYVREWEAAFAEVTELRILPKALWPVELTHEILDTLPVATLAELLRQASTRCVMFCPLGEIRPVFLAPDAWPHPGK